MCVLGNRVSGNTLSSRESALQAFSPLEKREIQGGGQCGHQGCRVDAEQQKKRTLSCTGCRDVTKKELTRDLFSQQVLFPKLWAVCIKRDQRVIFPPRISLRIPEYKLSNGMWCGGTESYRYFPQLPPPTTSFIFETCSLTEPRT